MLSDSHIDALRYSECFKGLNKEALLKVAALCEVRHYDKGEEIFHELDPGETLFVIVQGVVDVMISRPLNTGDDILVGPLKAGSCFGEISLVDGCFRSASVEAHLDVELLAIPDAQLRALFGNDHEIGYIFMLNTARILSTRIRDANLRLRNVISGLYV
jgi:CRP-like cAMP-binding protein